LRGTKEISRRIKSVQNTQKITQAMEMVAAAKLYRAQEKAEAARPFTNNLRKTIARIFKHSLDINVPLLSENQSQTNCFVVLTSDKGLCGSYNTNLFRLADQEIQTAEDEVLIIAIGRKGRDTYRRKGYNIVREYIDLEDRPGFAQAREIGHYLLDLFMNNEIGSAKLIYSEFVNPMVQKPRSYQLLPLGGEHIQDGEQQEESSYGDLGEITYYSYEPDPETVMRDLLPRFLNSLIYSGLLEAKASEFGARMTAMRTATDNAKEMIDNLTLKYNKARQAAITQEILEIVNTSEALKKE